MYDAYDQPVRVWGLSVTADQQIAGAIMKTGGSIFLWSIIVTLWFTRFAASPRRRARLPRGRDPTPSRTTRSTFDDVEREFASDPGGRTSPTG